MPPDGGKGGGISGDVQIYLQTQTALGRDPHQIPGNAPKETSQGVLRGQGGVWTAGAGSKAGRDAENLGLSSPQIKRSQSGPGHLDRHIEPNPGYTPIALVRTGLPSLLLGDRAAHSLSSESLLGAAAGTCGPANPPHSELITFNNGIKKEKDLLPC